MFRVTDGERTRIKKDLIIRSNIVYKITEAKGFLTVLIG
jgi:hypothetical protein